MSRVMSSMIKNKVIMTGLDRSKMEAGRPERRRAGGAVCTRAGVGVVFVPGLGGGH